MKNMKLFGKYNFNDVALTISDAYLGKSSIAKYTAEERKASADHLLRELGKDYEKNKEVIFAIIEQTLTAAIPTRVMESLEQIADVRYFEYGQAPQFRVMGDNIKAYHSAHGGVVPRHRLYDKMITLLPDVIQVNVYDELARLRAGLTDFVELVDRAKEAIELKIYERMSQALVSAVKSVPNANKITGDTIDEKELDRVMQVVGSYGKPIIIGTRLGLASLPKLDSHIAEDDIYNFGYMGKYKGSDVIAINNTVTDETNEEFVLEDKYVFVLPEGHDKVIKVAFEGDAMVREVVNETWDSEFRMKMDVGVAVLENHMIGVVENEGLNNA